MFRVRRSRSARDELTTLWLAADSVGRADLTAATNLIDGLLAAAAPTTGESRANNQRIVFVGRFRVIYQMEADRMTASVLQFAQTRKL